MMKMKPNFFSYSVLASMSAARVSSLARLDADWHPEFYVLAALGRNINQGLELLAFAFDGDHRRTDGKHRAGGDLDFEHASFDRADDPGVLGQLPRRGNRSIVVRGRREPG